MKPSNNLENETSSDQILLTSQGFLWISYPAWDSQWILFSFRSLLEGKVISESSRLNLLEKFSENDFASSDAEGSSSWQDV